MTTTTSSTRAEVLDRLRSRIRSAWESDPLFIDPIITPGLTANQITALERASQEASTSGIPHFVAVTPPTPIGAAEEWARFTSELAFETFESTGEEQAIVLFSAAEGGADSQAYLVTDNGPLIPPAADHLARSSSDDFLPIELAVAYHLSVLIAAAKGQDPPPPPQFDPPDVGTDSGDYIETLGLDNGNPDGLVFGASAVAALGLTTWVLRRRARYSWKTQLTSEPELVVGYGLVPKVESASEPLPDPVEADEDGWALHDRGRRVQTAIESITTTHPDWAEDEDFSHRHAIRALTRTDRWLRRRLQGRPRATDPDTPPRFCFFFPSHRGRIESFAWTQSGTTLTIDICPDCREDLNAGHEPVCLMVPRNPGARRVRPVPYYRRDDAYALSGFGSFSPLEDAVIGSASKEGAR